MWSDRCHRGGKELKDALDGTSDVGFFGSSAPSLGPWGGSGLDRVPPALEPRPCSRHATLRQDSTLPDPVSDTEAVVVEAFCLPCHRSTSQQHSLNHPLAAGHSPAGTESNAASTFAASLEPAWDCSQSTDRPFFECVGSSRGQGPGVTSRRCASGRNSDSCPSPGSEGEFFDSEGGFSV